MLKLLFVSFVFFVAPNVFQQEKPCLILNATAVLGNGEIIDNAAIAFQDGKFTLVADATSIKLNLQWYNVINGEGKFVYPLDMVKDLLDEIAGLDAEDFCRVALIREGGEASFAILSAPIHQNGKPETLLLKGRKLEVH